MKTNSTTCHFTGYITACQPKKVYSKRSQFYQQINYQITLKSGSESRQCLVYANSVPATVFRTIAQSDYSDQKYLFTCQKSKWGWILLDWQEINQ